MRFSCSSKEAFRGRGAVSSIFWTQASKTSGDESHQTSMSGWTFVRRSNTLSFMDISFVTLAGRERRRLVVIDSSPNQFRLARSRSPGRAKGRRRALRNGTRRPSDVARSLSSRPLEPSLQVENTARRRPHQQKEISAFRLIGQVAEVF